jgi:hypothetical protein
MDERTFEDIICKYPELIEDKLLFIGRQVNVEGKRVDVLLEDRHGQKLILELKKGTVRREDVSQLIDYEGYFVSSDDPNVRVMLVGTRVPENLRRSLDHHGFEWRELTTTFLVEFLRNNSDLELLNRIAPEESDARDTFINQRHSNGRVKRLSAKQAVVTSAPLAIHSQYAVERAIANIREEYLEDPSFHTVRHQNEANAREMLNSTIGKMSPEDIKRFLGYVNMESIKGKTGLTRFGRHFTTILSVDICGFPNEFNKWIGMLWRSEENDLQGALASFLFNAPIKGAGTLLPTFVLYLRSPSAFCIWTKNLEKNLAATFSYGQSTGKSQHERYTHFNQQVFDLLVTPFHLAPQEVDLVLSQLPKYVV